jgi:hypothetical protein
MSIFPPDGYDPRYWPQDGTDPKWTRWFAWYPVTVENGLTWLRWVECRLSPDGPPPNDVAEMQFRLPQ